MAKIDGDIIILGAGGKMGPSLCVLVKSACRKAGIDKRVIAVSRFGDPFAKELLTKNEVELVHGDLMDPATLAALPDADNVIFMAGRKFGTHGQECITWAMNTWLPAMVAQRYRNSRITVFSSGNIYPMVSPRSGGTDELTTPDPVGEYAMSCLGRERVFEYASQAYGTPVYLYRLNYAVDLRYGVLNDIAQNILSGQPVRISAPVFNCIWQGYANEIAIRCLLLCESPAARLNVSGAETVSVKWAALKLGQYLGRDVIIEEPPAETANDKALISNAAKMCDIFGYPDVSIDKLIRWQAEWLMAGGRILGKPTHFEERKGKF